MVTEDYALTPSHSLSTLARWHFQGTSKGALSILDAAIEMKKIYILIDNAIETKHRYHVGFTEVP